MGDFAVAETAMKEDSIDILLIEDNPGDVRLIRGLIQEGGDASFRIEHADRLETGLKRLAGGGIGAVLLDLSLPDGQGLDTLFRLRAHAPGVPVVVLTGHNDEPTAIQALREGAQDYLVKDRVGGDVLVRSLRYAKERVEILKVLGESEERFRRLVENAGDAFFLHDLEGEIIEVNQRACDDLGYTREELLGLPIARIVENFSAEKAAADWKALVPDTPVTIDGVHRRKDGTTFPVEGRLGVFVSGGRPIIHALARDVTERTRYEEQLRQSQKLDALGQLASGMAHDINNTLSVIIGHAQFLETPGLDPEVSRGLRIIEKAALGSARIVKQLQGFARKGEDRPHGVVNLNDVVRDVAEMTRPRWKDEAERKGLVLRMDIEARAEEATVQGDKTELHEALVNLGNNALDAMPEGGRITLSTENAGGRVRVRVSDSGVGMTPEVKERALEPFFTTKGERGTGLGLGMVYWIVERHGGALHIESAPGRGTTVRLEFRVCPRDPQSPREEAPSASHTGKILVIDDDADLVDIFSIVLRSAGNEVETATRPEDGVGLFREGSFDLVITDLGMPGMTGWEVAKAVKAIDPSAGVILVTGWRAEVDSGKAAECGIDQVLGKPVPKKVFLKVVSKVLGLRRRGIQKVDRNELSPLAP